MLRAVVFAAITFAGAAVTAPAGKGEPTVKGEPPATKGEPPHAPLVPPPLNGAHAPEAPAPHVPVPEARAPRGPAEPAGPTAPTAPDPLGGKRERAGKGGDHKADARKGGVKAGADAVDPGEAATPPSLSASGLRGELWRKPVAGGDERASLRAERMRLEELAADINKAREQLRQDTARLESMLQSGRGRGAIASAGSSTAGMPVGDPLQGSAPPPPPRDLQMGQVDAVSKALKGMKPEQSAAIVARLDRNLAAEIVRRMPAAEAGAMLGQLKPEVAAELATEIATRPSRDGGKGEKK
jgi:flagellar motility protein MotE (MotC chaperone)